MTDSKNSPKLRVAVAGLGAIGTKVVKALDHGIEGLDLAAVSAQKIDKHRAWLSELTRMPAVLVFGYVGSGQTGAGGSCLPVRTMAPPPAVG